MFTSYPDIVNIIQLKEMLGIGINLAYKLVRNKTIRCVGSVPGAAQPSS